MVRSGGPQGRWCWKWRTPGQVVVRGRREPLEVRDLQVTVMGSEEARTPCICAVFEACDRKQGQKTLVFIVPVKYMRSVLFLLIKFGKKKQKITKKREIVVFES